MYSIVRMKSYAVPSLGTIKPASKQITEALKFENIFKNDEEKTNTVSAIVKVIDGVYYIDNIVSNQECQQLCDEIKQSKDLSFWSDNEQGRNNLDIKAFRDADTIEIHSDLIASILWKRMEDKLQTLNINLKFEDEDHMNDDSWNTDLPGLWSPIFINNDILLARYASMGYFSPHTDGHTIQNFNIRSFYSVIIFLNDIPEGCGGGTKFYKNESVNQLFQNQVGGPWLVSQELCSAEVPPRAGRCLFFEQNHVHEGVMPQSPYEKLIIRTDIMFQRSPALLTEPIDVVAYEIYREAENLAEKGDQVSESISLFKKAFKMSPKLARIMQQG